MYPPSHPAENITARNGDDNGKEKHGMVKLVV